MLTPKSFPLFLCQSELLLKPLSNGSVVYTQEKKAPLIHCHLCRDIISKYVAPVLIRMQQATIIDGLPV